MSLVAKVLYDFGADKSGAADNDDFHSPILMVVYDGVSSRYLHYPARTLQPLQTKLKLAFISGFSASAFAPSFFLRFLL